MAKIPKVPRTEFEAAIKALRGDPANAREHDAQIASARPTRSDLAAETRLGLTLIDCRNTPRDPGLIRLFPCGEFGGASMRSCVRYRVGHGID